MQSKAFRQRFDEFQNDAVSAIKRDFSRKLNGRYLLVIPTAGGKTFTAVKAINRIFETDILDDNLDKVLWTAHRIELLKQAEDTFTKYVETYGETNSYEHRVIFEMISSVSKRLNDDTAIKLVVIDEAHHGAANSYQPIFEHPELGILGLTATPSRT